MEENIGFQFNGQETFPKNRYLIIIGNLRCNCACRVLFCVAGASERMACVPQYPAPITFKCLLCRLYIAFCAGRARHEAFETGKVNRLRSDWNFPSETTRKDSEKISTDYDIRKKLPFATNNFRTFWANDKTSTRYTYFSCRELGLAIDFLIDNIYVRFGSSVFRQVIGIPMCTFVGWSLPSYLWVRFYGQNNETRHYKSHPVQQHLSIYRRLIQY